MGERRAQLLRALDLDQWVRRDSVSDAPSADQSSGTEMAPDGLAAADGAAPVSSFDWPALEQAVSGCVKCALHCSRTQTVFGVGSRRAQLLVVGEAPGAEEDRQGKPFVGRAGQLLTAMLKACGFVRDDVFIANVLKCRPPGNRDPKPEEVAQCLPYLERQIALIDPRVILCVGRVAAQNLLGTDAPLGRLRGQVHGYGAGGRPVVVTYHPAYLLRSPAEKAKAWQDLLRVRDLLTDAGAGAGA